MTATSPPATTAQPVAEPLPRLPRWVWAAIAIGCIVPAFLGGAQIYMRSRFVEHDRTSWANVIFESSEWLFLGALTPIAYFMSRRVPLRRPHFVRNTIVHMAGALLLCIGWASLGVAARALLRIGWGVPIGRELASWALISLPYSVFMYFAIVGCMHAFAYWVEAREREAQTTRLAGQLAETRLDALRRQLNPHFLFNSLNAITVLVRDRRTDDASRMLELLSDVLRQVLRSDQPHEIALREEMAFLERYLAIEEVRFSDRLRIRIDVPDELLGAAVPVLLLQPLVENALRHGLVESEGGGLVEVRASRDGDDLVLAVRDAGTAAPVGRASNGIGIGLVNTRERLTTLYGARGTLELSHPAAGGTVATARLPYHEAP